MWRAAAKQAVSWLLPEPKIGGCGVCNVFGQTETELNWYSAPSRIEARLMSKP